RVGGRILLLTPILEEVATHAWISERDFEETRFLLKRLSPRDVQPYATNAFVRAFFGMVKSESDVKKWPAYISEFRGTAREDYSKILVALVEDQGAERLPDSFQRQLQERAAETLKSSIARAKSVSVDRLDKSDRDKADRDGQLLATIAAARAARKATNGRTV